MVKQNAAQQLDWLWITVADIAHWGGVSRFAARRYLIKLGLLSPNSGGAKARILMETIRERQPELYRAIKSRAASASLRFDIDAARAALMGDD